MTMLPAAVHPLSPPLESFTPVSSSNNLTADTIPISQLALSSSPPADGKAPLFPSSLESPAAPPKVKDGYFAARTPTASGSGSRPHLASNLTIRAPPPPLGPSSTSQSEKDVKSTVSPSRRSHRSSIFEPPDTPPPLERPPKSISFPLAPHRLPPSSPLLTSISPTLLVAMVQALSRDLEETKLELGRRKEESEALARVLKDKGVGDGEVERTRVRARVEAVEDLGGEKEWKLELRRAAGVEAEEEEEKKSKAAASKRELSVPTSPRSIRAEVQPITALDLDDLAEAMSENAFSFSSSSIADLDTPPSEEGEGEGDDEDEESSEVTGTTTPSTSQPTLADTSPPPPAVVATPPTAASLPPTPLATPPQSPPGTKVTRQRHASLSSRIFGSFSYSAPPSANGMSTSSSMSSISVPPSANGTITGSVGEEATKRSKKLGKEHKRTGSIGSVSSVASGASGASGVSDTASKETGGSGYGEWLGWKSWTLKSAKEKEEFKRSKLAAAESDESVEDGVRDGGGDDERGSEGTGLGLRLDMDHKRPKDDSALSSLTSHHAAEPSALPSPIASVKSHQSGTRSSLVPSDVPSSPTTSTSPPPSSITPDKPRSRTSGIDTNNSSPGGSPQLSRGSRMPTLVAQHGPASPTLSTPTTTSTISVQPLSTPRLTRTLSQSKKPRSGVQHSDPPLPRPSHFAALTQSATRSLAKSQPPIFAKKDIGTLVQKLAGDLVSHVASETTGLTATADDTLAASDISISELDPDKTIKAHRRSSAASKQRPPTFLSVPVPLYSADSSAPPKAEKKGYVFSAKGTIGRALGLGASASSSLGIGRVVSGGPDRQMDTEPNLTMFPKLASLSRYTPFAQPALSTPSTYVTLSSHSLPVTNHPQHTPLTSAPSTMELGTISGEAAPPTLALHNPATGRIAGDSDEGPMVDRYGFLWDVKSGMRLLREARRRQAIATNGYADDDDEEAISLRAAAAKVDAASPGPLSEEERIQLEVEVELEALREALGLPPSNSTSPTLLRSPAPRLGKLLDNEHSPSPSTRLQKPASLSGSSRSSSPRPPKDSAGSRLIRSTSTDNVSPTPALSSGQQSMKRLLAQLTDMHDATEKTQKEAWEIFIGKRQTKLRQPVPPIEGKPAKRGRRQRSNVNVLVKQEEEDAVDDEAWSEDLVGVAQMGLAGKSGKEDWAEFKLLVRKGVPIAFRPKIWAECSGANEAREPGVYQELLARHNGEANRCLTQIDMDCHRTFPTNVFFAGSGPGVTKLRNILIAYSWRNPAIGYCQGMNNLAATLLLTHPAEEDAFWVMVCLIEKILPTDYYTSHLLVSQADQRVLRDLVEQHMPEMSAHLENLGVELPAITFGWFLSLFTDALPIQTLLRVWDLLFVFGTVILFRVALGILQIHSAEILACDSAATLYGLMRTLTTHLYQVDRLLKIACEDLRTVVKDRDITSLRDRHVAELMHDLGLSPLQGEDDRNLSG